ncbi:MAG: hypothetical protein IKE01_04270 [Clostridia bacterium]|nr:hypothetical protein [Clostridia bacterium]
MVDRESIIKFFEENGIQNEKNITSLKNIYLIFDIINDEESYKDFIEGEAGSVRNPYKRLGKLKPEESLMSNITLKIKGAGEIDEVNKQGKLDYCKSVIMATAILYKMGYHFSDEEFSRAKSCYMLVLESLNKRRSKLGRLKENIERISGVEMNPYFPIDDFHGIFQNISNNDYPSEKESSKYRKGLLEVLVIFNDDNKTNEMIRDAVAGGSSDNIAQIMDIINLIGLGRVNFNERINVNSSKYKCISYMIDSRATSYESLIDIEEIERSYEVETEDSSRKRAEYERIIDQIYEKTVAECKSGEDFVRCLQDNLNKAIRYNTIAFSWSQENDNIVKIINRDKSDDINFDENAVTCHTWSRAMMDLLDRAGYDTYLIGRSGHQHVLFFDENNNAFVVDGTNSTRDEKPNWLRAPDISRSKLGLTPNHMYQVLGSDEYLRPEQKYYSGKELKSLGDIKKSQKERLEGLDIDLEKFKTPEGTYDYKAILKFIDENPSVMEPIWKKLREDYPGDKTVGFLNEVVSALTKGYEDDDLLMYNCLANIYYALTSGEGSVIKDGIEALGIKPAYSMGISHSLYKKVGDGTKLVQLIYIREKDGVKYYIWDDAGKFEEISKQELRDKINLGVYHSSKNNDSRCQFENRYVIPGIRTPKRPIEQEEEEIFGKKTTAPDEFGWIEI